MSENEEEKPIIEEHTSLIGAEAFAAREDLNRRMAERQKQTEGVDASGAEKEMSTTKDLGTDLDKEGSEAYIKEATFHMVADFTETRDEGVPTSLQDTLLSTGATKSYLVADDTETRILANSTSLVDGETTTAKSLGTTIESATGVNLGVLVDSTAKISEAVASLALGETSNLAEVNQAVKEYADAVKATGEELKQKGKGRVWELFTNRLKAVFGVGSGELRSVPPVDKLKPAEPETFIERMASTVEVAMRYRSRFNAMFEIAKISGHEEEHASVDLKKRVAKETLFFLSLRNPLRSINNLQDIFFSQRKGAPGRDVEGTPIAQKDKVMAFSESASFFKYGELGGKYREAIESRGGVSKSEQTAYAIRSMLEIAATDKKDKFHILPEKKMFNVWGAKQREGRDVTFMIFHKDAPYRVSIPVERGGELPSIETISSSLAFMNGTEKPSHAISRNDKIKLRRLAYSRDKKDSTVVKALGKADFSIVIDEVGGLTTDKRRQRVNAADSLALTYGRETKACMVLQFEEKDGQPIAKGMDMKFSHPWFNGKDADEMQFDIAMRMSARAQKKLPNSEGSIVLVDTQKVDIKKLNLTQKETEFWNDDGVELLPINREVTNWLTMSGEEIKDINDRIGALKKKGIPITFGVLTAYAQAVGTGSDAFHQTYHCKRTDDLDIAIGVIPRSSGYLYEEYLRLGLEPTAVSMAHPTEAADFKSRMVRLLKKFDIERKATLDNRGSISTMAATAGVLEPAMKPMAEFLTGEMKNWVANPGTMNSMLISGFDKDNPEADLGELQRRTGTGNTDTYKRMGFEGHTTGYLVPQGFDTAQTESYLHEAGKGVMGGGEIYMGEVDDGLGIETRGVTLSMRVDLEQSTVETARVLSNLIKTGRHEEKDVRANLEINMVRLVQLMNNPNSTPTDINAFVVKLAEHHQIDPMEFATKLNLAQRSVASRRASRIRGAMSFVLDMLETE